ncbi:MAG: hypothetical protein ACKVSF_13150 [Alphaproteobacteria bacterium]
MGADLTIATMARESGREGGSVVWTIIRAVFLGGLAALAFAAAKIYARHWPHEADAMAGEALALIAAVAVAALALRLMRRPAKHAAWLGGGGIVALYLALSAADPRFSLSGGLRQGEPRGYLFGAEGCEFTVRFPRRPDIGRSVVRLPENAAVIAFRAEIADVGKAAYYRAECIPLAGEPSAEDRARLGEWMAEHLRAWVRASGGELEDARIETLSDGSLGFHARHLGRGEANQALTSFVAARAVLGQRAMMALVVTRLGAEDDGAFFASLAPRR